MVLESTGGRNDGVVQTILGQFSEEPTKKHGRETRLTGTPSMAIIMVIMTRRQPFSLVYDGNVKEHLCAVESKHHPLIRSTIEQQLLFEPDVATHNRKPLQRPVAFEATWELRFGPQNRFRIFYDVNRESHEVDVLAFGVKVGNRLTIGGEEVEL